MDDLIYRQAALDIVYFECDKWTGLAKTIEKEFNELPSVEAEPVRHGKWLTDNDAFKRMYLVCSLCKRATQTPWYVGGFLYDYCPNCGAKMDEVTSGD